MSLRACVLCLTLTALVLTAGCGPGKEGLKARGDARDRVDQINARLAYDQAMQAFEIGKFDLALREIKSAISRDPEAPEYHVLEGRVYLETHRLEPALRSFEAALEQNDEYAEAHYYAGIVFERWSDDAMAHEHHARAYELEPTTVQYLLAAAESLIDLGKFGEARVLIEDKLAYFEYNAALRHVLGQIALLQQDPKTAARLYAEARLLSPDDDALLEELAWAQFQADQFAQCLETVKQLQRQSKDKRDDLQHLEARCLAVMERSAEARDLYIDLTRRNPTDVNIWIELGMVAWELGDFRRVATSSVRVIALDPNRYEGYMLKGLNEDIIDGNRDNAIGLMQQATRRATETAMPHLLLGRFFEEAGRSDEALLAYHKALEVEPDNAEARMLLDRRRLSAVEP